MRHEFDSDEEFEFFYWLLEARYHGLIGSAIEYQPETYVLSEPIQYKEAVRLKTKVKHVDRSLLSGCSYTPDFSFKVLNGSIQRLLKNTHTVAYKKTIVDVKGSFAGKRNSSAVTFPIKQKWLYQKYGIYVEKVIPKQLFKKTWVPEAARYTEKKKDIKKMYIGVPTIKEFLKGE